MIKKMRFMTRREWVAKYRPERIDENACGGIMGCPGWVEKTKYILVNEVHDNAKK